jgi:hypothetical protein
MWRQWVRLSVPDWGSVGSTGRKLCASSQHCAERKKVSTNINVS